MPKAPGCSILVVDDDPAILGTVSDILCGEGYVVATATSGFEALDCIQADLPQLILLDMRMPGMSGPDLARVLRERGLAPPIFVMTAAQDAARWAREIDAAGAVPKPFDVADLLDAVEQVCGPALHGA